MIKDTGRQRFGAVNNQRSRVGRMSVFRRVNEAMRCSLLFYFQQGLDTMAQNLNYRRSIFLFRIRKINHSAYQVIYDTKTLIMVSCVYIFYNLFVCVIVLKMHISKLDNCQVYNHILNLLENLTHEVMLITSVSK